jgi:acyl-CoA dehydrogenase
MPGQFRTRLESNLERALRFAEEVAATREYERFSRVAANGLYQATTAVLMASEAVALGTAGGDARRLLLARFVLEHRMGETQPTNIRAFAWEEQAITHLLSGEAVSLDIAAGLVTA